MKDGKIVFHVRGGGVVEDHLLDELLEDRVRNRPRGHTTSERIWLVTRARDRTVSIAKSVFQHDMYERCEGE